jgi:RecA-family ATPase
MTAYLAPQFDAIPAELRKLQRWVTWAAIPKAGEKDRKEPFAPDRINSHASSTDPTTWGTFDQAEAAYLDGDRTGVGIVLNGDGLVGVDIDHCVSDGVPSPEALALLDKLGAAYIEISPSGTGLRALGYAEQLTAGVNGSKDGLKAEFYSTGRYLTLTGQTIKAGPIAQLKNFAATAESFRTVKTKKVNPKTGNLENVPPDEQHAAIVESILSGDVYHDSLRDMAARLVSTGMKPGAAVNHLRGLMDASQGPHDERWRARRGQIPDLVSSATAKFAAADFDAVDTETSEANKVHPLAWFVEVGDKPKPPRWTIPGFVGHGVVVIAGAHGVGKTTVMVPLCLTVAGLHGGELMPCQWRHVVYITEDVEQARRILAGIVGYSGLNISMEQVRERFHLVEAVRLDPAFVATVGRAYREQFTRTVEGVEVLPLVVLDTKSAVLALENENDNSEASRMMAALKQGFDGLPVWLIGHVAKPNLNRSDVTGLTSRGASAIEGDANQTMFLVREGDTRFLVLGKTRFEPKWRELEITSYTASTFELDEFGNLEEVTMRWGIAAPAQQSRKEASEQAAELAKREDEATLRQDIRDAIDTAWRLGSPLNREGVKAKLQRKNAVVVATIENLLSEQWLYEVCVPTKERLHPRKSSFFVNFTTEEHEAVLRGEGLPVDKLVIPTSWRKSSVPSVPADLGTIDQNAGVEDEQ